MSLADQPVGLFDSGVGGLTVVKELFRRLPDEEIVYFGDTARVPYGTKSRETIVKFAIENSQFLLRKGIKLLVVACNSASAVSMPALREAFALPIIGVIEAGARAAVRSTRTGKVAVIGTRATISSNAYNRAIKAIDPVVEIIACACPLFVPLVEEGWLEDPVTREVARKYLAPLLGCGVDTLVLGCTHYPLLKPLFEEILGPGVRLIDSGEEVAAEVAETLAEQGLRRPAGNRVPKHSFFVSDDPQLFEILGQAFLGEKLTQALQVVF